MTKQQSGVDIEYFEPAEWEYQSELEATTEERHIQRKEAAWEADDDWQAFRLLCYPDLGPPTDEELDRAFQHLQAAVARGNAEAQYRLATILHVGYGPYGLPRDLSRAASLYQCAIERGHLTAVWQLEVLKITHPDIFL